jgi:hypothetical protein
MYWEDADLCFRVKQRAWRVFAVPAAVVIHHEGRSSTRKAQLIMEFHRSVYRYYRKHHVRSSLSPMNLFAFAGLTVRTVLLLTANAVKGLLPARSEPDGRKSMRDGVALPGAVHGGSR